MPTVSILVPSKPDAVGQVAWTACPETVPATGLPVNLFVGATGAGKTSCIQMLADGNPTTTEAGASDTKKLGLYRVNDEAGNQYLILDTIGLVDTASTNDQRMEFIRQLIEFVRNNDIRICKVFFVAPLGGRFMTEAVAWTATLMDALGDGKTVSIISCWLCTQYNMAGRLNKTKSQNDLDSPKGLYNTLKKHESRFDVVTHGEENSADLFGKMVKMQSRALGLDNRALNAATQHHDNLVKEYKTLDQSLQEQKEIIDKLKGDADFERELDTLSEQVDAAATSLANCTGRKKQSDRDYYRDAIQQANAAIAATRKDMQDASSTREQKTSQLHSLNNDLQQKLKDLGKREGVMASLGSIGGIARETAGDVLNLATSVVKRLRKS